MVCKNDYYPNSTAKKRTQITCNCIGTYQHCCAVSREHPLAQKKRLAIEDLYGQTLMMVKQGDSGVVDDIRAEIQAHPLIRIEDTPPVL